MPDSGETNNPESLWKSQPMDPVAINFKRIAGRRAREFDFATRVEIYVSVCAALFFLAALSTRFHGSPRTVMLIGLAGVTFWASILVYRFRDALAPRRRGSEELAATGLDHYRAVLIRRRDHLKHFWTWQGPLLMALAVTVGVLVQTALPSLTHLRAAIPFFVLLVVWVVFAVVLRLRKIGELQREIDELEP